MSCCCGQSDCRTDRSPFHKLGALIFISLGLLLGIIFENSLELSGLYFYYFLLFYIIAGNKVVLRALKGILSGDVFNENFLMSIATIGALILGEAPEALGVMVFYRIGNFFEELGEYRSKKSIESLLDLRPDTIAIKTDDAWLSKPLSSAQPHDIYLLKTGERNGVDGIVIKGEALVDTAALTGESVPRLFKAGDKLLAGMILKNGLLEIEVLYPEQESSLERILSLTQQAINNKSKPERFVRRFAKIYTPIVVLLCLLVAFIPPLFLSGDWETWVIRALTMLVISCPCALVVSVPLAYFSGIGLASRKGLLFKGSQYIDLFNSIDTIVFDKTGTLTTGQFQVTAVKSIMATEGTFLELAKAAEYFSNHPIAESVKEHCHAIDINKNDLTFYTEEAGQGIAVQYKGKLLLAGNKRLMDRHQIAFEQNSGQGTVVYISYDGVYQGHLVIDDQLKEHSLEVVNFLHQRKSRVFMLTGDHYNKAKEIADQLHIDQFYADLMPEDKLDKLREIMQQNNKKTLFIGDGINDAPALAYADIGMAMGKGSDSAIDTADVVVLNNNIKALEEAFTVAKATHSTVLFNIIFSLTIKILFIALSAGGLATMWGAVFADTGVLILAIINSLILLKR